MATNQPKSPEEQYPNGGPRDCLKCSRRFFSTHIICNRICKSCSKENRSIRLPRTYRILDTPGVELPPDDNS